MNPKTQTLLKEYHLLTQEMAQLSCIAAVLDWDHQVNLPPKGAKGRADQMELMSKLSHERQTSPRYQEIVNALSDQIDTLSPDDQVNIRESKYQMEKSLKLPLDFVARMSQARSHSYEAWLAAKKKSDFSLVRNELKLNIELAREEAEYLGYEETRYDALLDNYEAGSKLSLISKPLYALADAIKEILPEIRKKISSTGPAGRHFKIEAQAYLNRRVATDFGYDFEAGRLDIAPHPFMTTLGPGDRRITTRYDETDYLSSLLTTMHEVGHALYEQGLPSEHFGTPRGSTISLSIHESQSRIWENIIGRSRPFAKYLHSILGDYFPEEAKQVGTDYLWQRLNQVRPSLIRVEADEVTYSLHIMIRMRLEQELINEGLSVDELPTRWIELYREYLGLQVTDDAHGVLQDVHWYGVGIGYFPTYALGNLYSAIMMQRIEGEVENLEQKIASGNFKPILSWLRKHVHEIGMSKRGPELALELGGAELSEQPFVGYLKRKFGLN